MAYKQVNALEVRCWGRRVGALALDPTRGYYAFEYYPEFRQTGFELAPLMLPLATRGATVFPNLPDQTFLRLPPFIADSLPDYFGNSLIDAWMARNGLDSSAFSPLDRLAYIGKRGMGALEYHPAIRKGRKAKATAVELGELVSAARKAVAVNLKFARPEDIDAELAQLIEIGTSAGGARAKAVVGFNPETGAFLSGQLDIPEGFEHWLIKFDTAPDDAGAKDGQYGRIEYAYYLMAQACGINMAESQLYEINNRAHFMTKRFDRGENNSKHHIQTLCALKGMDYHAVRVYDYAQLFLVAGELNLAYEAYDELFRRMVFNIALSNNDDHTKNHAFLLKEGKEWELAPAYDVTHARNSAEEAWTKAHVMGVDGVFSHITREGILKASAPYPIKNPEQIIDRAVAVAQNWPQFAEEASLTSARTNQIAKDINTCTELLSK
ncbi:MAG: type II toxin-antitoxin system HipA family toxin [Coriobacteriia bacterium]|nr:type II toxin-antitoxin system HipA family toxin [Coriobacteriia bacterium]MCL2750639.1 type II toxin-antitoxin system HipA family toxin [Coriobacteriia bacterium]